MESNIPNAFPEDELVSPEQHKKDLMAAFAGHYVTAEAINPNSTPEQQGEF